jgi:hypothetical protein
MSFRRSLRASWLAAGAALLASPAPAGAAPPRCEHVVLVVLGGGVRTKELLGRPDLAPNARAIAREGFAVPGWAAAGTGHEDAVEGILTGRRVPVRTRTDPRPGWPTVLEYARKGLGLAPEGAWYASYADGEALALAASAHAEYGAAWAPRLAHGEGPFGEPMKSLFALFGRPNPTKPRTWEILASLRSGPAGAAAEDARLERALLEEVDRRAAASGAAGLDARAVRAAITALRVFRPRLVVVRLGQADVGHKDLFAYWDVVKRDDSEIGRLRDEIRGDPALASTTALLVAPEIGRDAEPNALGGIDHDDGSEHATTVAVLGEGAGIRRGAVAKGPLSLADLCPTIGALLGFPTPHAEGTAREELLRPR